MMGTFWDFPAPLPCPLAPEESSSWATSGLLLMRCTEKSAGRTVEMWYRLTISRWFFPVEIGWIIHIYLSSASKFWHDSPYHIYIRYPRVNIQKNMGNFWGTPRKIVYFHG